MAKHKIGDMFIATITDVNDTGMGTTYAINDAIIVNDMQLARLEPYVEKPSDLTENGLSDSKPREYTLEELLERIFVITDLLNKTTEAYLSARSSLRKGIESADSGTEKLNA